VVDDVGNTDAVDDERLSTMNAIEEGTLDESAGIAAEIWGVPCSFRLRLFACTGDGQRHIMPWPRRQRQSSREPSDIVTTVV
jgi:hypothetical protein